MIRYLGAMLLAPLLFGCAAPMDRHTLADLDQVRPELSEMDVTDSLDKALQGYLHYLQETPANRRTPEALRRLADLQLEREYGALVGSQSQMAAPQSFEPTVNPLAGAEQGGEAKEPLESEADFESRASEVALVPFEDAGQVEQSADWHAVAGETPRGAIATYRRILDTYPHYERNDQVLYQMARAYDELGENEQAIETMQRLSQRYPNSEYLDEIFFRRGEYFFIRRQYLDAEDAYGAVVALRRDSQFHELALYKLGWTFYKQELYDEALHKYIELLDYKLAQGYDFDSINYEADVLMGDLEEERRVADTFRVISLAFSNLGGADILNEYFAQRGSRSYEDRIYSNLAEFYVEKLRFNDAADVYRSFVDLNPLHRRAPHFSMRVVQIYGDGGFPQLVVQAKKDFARHYGLESEYWHSYDQAQMPDVLDHLKTNLFDLAQHFHALYQEPELDEQQNENYAEALLWYRQYLTSFPDDEQAPSVNYQLADLLLEQGQFDIAAREYERTAYDYPRHEKAAEAGYAAIFAHRENLQFLSGDEALAAKRATVDSSLRFANTFANHDQAPMVLAAATDDLYAMGEYEATVHNGMQLIEVYPDADRKLTRSAWTAVSHAHMELGQYAQAESGYGEVLERVGEDDPQRGALTENQAAAIYKQGELARDAQELATAAEHFLRIQQVAPASSIRPAAEYDAAVALIKLEEWSRSAAVLRAFRADHVGHELQSEVTKQLAFVYQKAGELAQSADEFRRVAAQAEEPALRAESLLQAGTLYQQAERVDAALSVYGEYVATFPEPLEPNVETRYTIAQLLRGQQDEAAYHEVLREIVTLDREAGTGRTDRVRYLAAQAALVLAQPAYEHFASMTLQLPFQESLAEKQRRMDASLQVFEALPDYEVGEVTAAATYYMAEIYRNFSDALLDSQRPAGLTGAEQAEYNLVLEEEAYPFEERAIEVHEANIELARAGAYSNWVERSLEQLARLVPGQYARAELSAGYIPEIERYAYRSPLADAEDETMTAEVQATELLEVSRVY